jgi:hypothetical protein
LHKAGASRHAEQHGTIYIFPGREFGKARYPMGATVLCAKLLPYHREIVLDGEIVLLG